MAKETFRQLWKKAAVKSKAKEEPGKENKMFSSNH